MPQKATVQGEQNELTSQQCRALELLVSGKTITATADAVGVRRETVHRWYREDHRFRAEFNRCRRELQEAVEGRLLSAAVKAADTVAQAVEEGNLTASMALLKGIGALRGERPLIDSDNAKLLAEEAELQMAESKANRASRRLAASGWP